MKVRHLITILLISVTSSCGIPKDKQESMETSLRYELNNSFLNDSKILPSGIIVELSEAEKNNSTEEGEYKALYAFKFHDFWSGTKYRVGGVAYFDKYGSIINKNGKKSIRVYTISQNHRLLSSEEIIQLRPKDLLGW